MLCNNPAANSSFKPINPSFLETSYYLTYLNYFPTITDTDTDENIFRAVMYIIPLNGANHVQEQTTTHRLHNIAKRNLPHGFLYILMFFLILSLADIPC